MGKIFVSYRRVDTGAIVGRICDRLNSYFGTEKVFFDIESIPLGVDFRPYITQALAEIDVMVVLVGPGWVGDVRQKVWEKLTRRPARRIDYEDDLVRVEVETALEMGIPVIPVLIFNAAIPSSVTLPPKLQKLFLKNATRLDEGSDFEVHAKRLIKAIDYHLGGSSAKGVGKERRGRKATDDYMQGSLDNYLIRFGQGADVVGINLIARMHFPPELILSKKEIGRWLKSDKGIFRVAVRADHGGSEQHLVGYYAVFSLMSETYEKLKNHEIDEKNITLDDLQDPYSVKSKSIYILDLAKHSEETIGAALLRDLIRYLAHIVKRNPGIKNIGTWAFSAAGQEIALRLGMDQIKDYEDYEDTSFFEITEPGAALKQQLKLTPHPGDHAGAFSGEIRGRDLNGLFAVDAGGVTRS